MERVYENKPFFRGESADFSAIVGAVSSSVHGRSVSDFDFSNCILLPGFADVHVHFREPGFSYKETMASGSASAARGGYTTVCTMPNLAPVPDCLENLEVQLELIRKQARLRVIPYGAITCGEQGKKLADMAAMAPYVVGFSDDGRGVMDAGMMREAMEIAASLGKMIVAHCEDTTLIEKGGCIHDGEYARKNGFVGISSESEWKQLERDLMLAQDVGCSYHMCHLSTKESAELIRQAKKAGVDATCETAPHYLLLDDSCLQDEGRFKMNPPLRSAADREALLEACVDGTIDMIATDHAPHGAEEKAKGLRGSVMGIVGLETAFPLLYTYLVKPGHMSLERVSEMMSLAPAKRFGLERSMEEDFCVYDLGCEYPIDPAEFASMGRATPFAGWKVYGRNRLTVCGKNMIYSDLQEERDNA